MSATATQIPVSELPVGSEWPDDSGPAIETIIQPSRGWLAVPWAEMARQRELLFFLIWRDIKVRYKQAVLGFAWVVLQPIINVIIFSTIFGAGLGLSAQLGKSLQGAYPVFVFAGLLPWQLFSRALNEGGMSLVNQQHLLTKIYFPRLFVPTASVGGALFDMMISLPVFAAMLLIFHVTPPWTVVFLPFLVILTVMFASGMAYLLSALTVTYRDFRFLIPFMVQIWLWVSFIMFPVPANMLSSPKWQVLLTVNPMYAMVAAYRKVLLPNYQFGPTPLQLGVSIGASLAVFTLGIFYFRRTERRFADIA